MKESLTFSYRDLPVSIQKIGQGKPLIILHGWGSSSRVMTPTANALADIRTCYLVDLPGFGETPPPESPWNLDDYADLITRWASELKAEKVDFLVHSFGARILLKLCAREDSGIKVGKILITGGAGMKPKRSLTYYLKTVSAKLIKAPFTMLPASTRKNALDWLRSTALWRMMGSSDYSKLDGVMRETFVRTVTDHLDNLLPKIDHEILLLWGEEDSATPLYQAERMEAGLSNSALVTIKGAGHYAFLDRPKRFTVIAKAFFEG